MEPRNQTARTCEHGHRYYKSSSCPACPICEAQRKPQHGFLSLLSAPARRALENKGIVTLHHLATYSETEILKLHGVGKASMPILKKALEEHGRSFKDS
jgi:predicted RecB family nuclease